MAKGQDYRLEVGKFEHLLSDYFSREKYKSFLFHSYGWNSITAGLWTESEWVQTPDMLLHSLLD